MQIVCPDCATSYEIEASSLGGAGRSVRCVRCRAVWFARPDAVADGVAADAFAAETDTPPSEITTPAAEQIPSAIEHGADVPHDEASDLAPEASSEAAEANGAADVSPNTGAEVHEPVTLHDAPPLAPMESDVASLTAEPAALSEAGEDIETVAARRARRDKARRGLRLPRLDLRTAILALVAINAALIGWRADLVRALPQTNSFFSLIGMPVNLRGLTFEEVTTSRETHDGVPVLVVEGAIENVAKAPAEVPRMRFAVRNSSGAELYTWTSLPARTLLAPGEKAAFRSRLASPPSEGREVHVRFFSRRDAAAGMK